MHPTQLRLLVLSIVCCLASTASAQSTDARPPAVRVDVDAPSIGVALSSDDDPRMVVGVGVRVAHRSGHGLLLGGAWSDAPGAFAPVWPTAPARERRFLVDLAYLRRFRLEGDDRLGVGLDLFGGPSTAHVDPMQASGGFASEAPRSFDARAGWYLGVVAGASLDLRVHAFTVGIDARYHGLVALEPASPFAGGDRLDLHSFEAGLHVGFAFY